MAKVLDTTSRPQYAHYTFDFAEQLHIPHHARQVGPIYFKVCRKIQLFGVCCDSNKKQVNYLIGVNGTKTHGPNAVISMLDHYFTNHSLQERDCHLHCDNCVGQNKNNYVVGYLAWRVLKQKHNNITLSFVRAYQVFSGWPFWFDKKIYRQSDSDTLKQISQVVNQSSSNNVAQIFDWQW